MKLFKNDRTPVDDLIDTTILNMETMGYQDPDYPLQMENLKELYALKADDRPTRLSPDTFFTGVVNLVGIFAVIKHEKLNVITSQAWKMVAKLPSIIRQK